MLLSLKSKSSPEMPQSCIISNIQQEAKWQKSNCLCSMIFPWENDFSFVLLPHYRVVSQIWSSLSHRKDFPPLSPLQHITLRLFCNSCIRGSAPPQTVVIGVSRASLSQANANPNPCVWFAQRRMELWRVEMTHSNILRTQTWGQQNFDSENIPLNHETSCLWDPWHGMRAAEASVRVTRLWATSLGRETSAKLARSVCSHQVTGLQQNPFWCTGG